MLTKILNNGIEKPMLGFGTFMLVGETCENAVAEAIAHGCRMIDTAEAYGNEEAVGRGIVGNPNRPELVEMSLTW